MTIRRPEILAPAGDPIALRAALAAGADAVYLGMARFNARGRAERFRGVTLEACVRAAHRRGARVYVTLNTLLHDDELDLAIALAREAVAAGADAAIVQDAGFALRLREEVPELSLHGSTQMTIHQPEQAAEAVVKLGLRRIILARECTLEEARRVADRIRPLGAGLEVFVHGALCFAYSGQCLMSNYAGKRSANRGICAQNCRFDFASGPVRSDEASPAGTPTGSRYVDLPVFSRRDATQLISMKDLAAFESVAALAGMGVESFKIEGRLKGPDYVAEVVRLYRSALDAWEEGVPFDAAEAGRAAARVYSRGFTNGYLGAGDGSERFGAMRGDKRRLEGEPDAFVLSAHRTTGSILLEPRPGHEIRAGQGYRYAHDRYRGGFRVIAVKESAGGASLVRARFGAEASGRRHRRGAAGRRRPPPPLPAGLPCYLNSDPEVKARIDALVAGVAIDDAAPVRVSLRVSGAPGAPLRVEAAAGGSVVEAATEAALEEARGRALTPDILAEHLGRLGGTRYELEGLDASGLAPKAFASFPSLHELRRRLVAALDASLEAPRAAVPAVAPPRPRAAPAGGAERRRRTSLAACVADPAAREAVLGAGASRVIIDADAFLASPGSWLGLDRGEEEVWFRLPPIRHDAGRDRAALEALGRARARPAVLVGHLGQLALARELGLSAAADVYLNATNRSALEALRISGACRAALSLELDANEAARLSLAAPPGIEVEVVAGGEVFSMLTRQPFGLAPGRRLGAVSEHGHAYRFEADPSGTTTLFEARELVGARALPALAGKVDSIRLDLAHQSVGAAGAIVAAYAEALALLLDDPASDAARSAVEAAAETHARHAPAGAFPGHLIRSSRSQDAG